MSDEKELSHVVNLYFKFLCDLVKIEDPNREETYYCLARTLHKKEFFWTIDMDENRSEDGKNMRDKFLEYYDDVIFSVTELTEIDGPCSVFEMIVALSQRVANEIIYSPKYPDRTSEIFWIMMQNWGIDEHFCDAKWYDSVNKINGSGFPKDILESKIETLLERKYKKNGEGSLFPDKNCGADLRKIDIWYQMLGYFNSHLM